MNPISSYSFDSYLKMGEKFSSNSKFLGIGNLIAENLEKDVWPE